MTANPVSEGFRRKSGDSREGFTALAGCRAWIITDGAAGLIVQARGLSDALGLDHELKTIAPTGVWRFMAPWGGVAPLERLGQPGSQFAEPWPDVVIASGRQAIPYVRAIRRAAGPTTYTVVLQDPKTNAKTADLIWVPQHDKRRGTNVIATPTAPHSFPPERLRSLRANVPDPITALPGPRVGLILGGKTKTYHFANEDVLRLQKSLSSLAALGVSFMITPSRRSHPELIAAVDEATSHAPRIFWQGEGDNPYPDFLANADVLIVTADSTNMCGEAASTGRPVYTFMPSGGSAKFQRFHDTLQSLGVSRALPDTFSSLETWDYEPIDSTEVIAKEIATRFLQRQKTLMGR